MIDYAWIVNNRLRPWLRGWTETTDGYKFARIRNRKTREWTHPEHNEDFLKPIILNRGDTFLDIGANIGAWTVRAAPFYRQVISVEPIFYKALRKSLKLNHIDNTTIFPFALSNNFVKAGITFQENPRRVKSVSLDSLCGIFNIYPTIIKIDAEGAGFWIVAEGLFTIRKYRPTIIVEVHTEEECRVEELLPDYVWLRLYREMPPTDHIYREQGKQVFLVGRPLTR